MEEAERLRARARHCRALADADPDLRDQMLRVADECEAAAAGLEARRARRRSENPGIFQRLRRIGRREN